MLSDEEKKAIEMLRNYDNEDNLHKIHQSINVVLNLIEKQQKEIERTNEILIWKQKHEEQLQKEIEELKEKNKTLKNLQNDTNRLYIEMIERKNYFERELQKVEDKIKAKIEEVHYKMIGHQDLREAVKQALRSLLEKE